MIMEMLPEEKVYPAQDEPEEIREPEKSQTGKKEQELPEIEGIDWQYARLYCPDDTILLDTVCQFYDMAEKEADTLTEALELIPKEKPDLILLDYEMQGMDGKDTFEAMKADEMMRWIPVVFLTSIADRQAIYSVLKSKPDGYILKPPDEKRILETIRELI